MFATRSAASSLSALRCASTQAPTAGRRWFGDLPRGARATTPETEGRAQQRRAALRDAKGPKPPAPLISTSPRGFRHNSADRGSDPATHREPATKPTVAFAGWAIWTRDGRLPHEAQDEAMTTACRSAFGKNCRAATWVEYEQNQIEGIPEINESDLWLHFTGKEGWGYDNGKGYQWKKCVWRKRPLNGKFTEDSCSASICSAAAVKPIGGSGAR